MTTEQALAQLLDHMLSGKGIDAMNIVRALAKADPELLCQLAGLNPVPGTDAYLYEILSSLQDGNKVGAIKALRAKTGMGLKESKDVIDTFSGQDYGVTLTENGLYELGRLRAVSGKDYM